MIEPRTFTNPFTLQQQGSRLDCPARCGWVRSILMLLISFAPVIAFAHESASEFETEIGSREKYLELVNQVAPVFELQDVGANPVRLDDFRGKVVILNFLYSRCNEQCPLHSVKLAKIQQQLALASVSDRIQFITIATDTEIAASTAESMREHGPRYGLDPSNWLFLYGGEGLEDLGLRFAAGYGLKFVPTGNDEQMHGIITFLIDASGQLRARYHGLKFNSVNLTLHAAALIHDDHNKGDAKSVDSTALNAKVISIVLFAVFVTFIGLAGTAIFYYWKRRRHGVGRAQASPTGGSTE